MLIIFSVSTFTNKTACSVHVWDTSVNALVLFEGQTIQRLQRYLIPMGQLAFQKHCIIYDSTRKIFLT